MKKLAVDFAREIGIIILIGVLPIVYAFTVGGANIAEQLLLKLLVDSRVIFYFLGGAGACLLVAWLEYRLVFGSAALEGVHKFITSILLEAVQALVGILRIMAGAVLGFLGLASYGAVDVLGNISQPRFAMTGALATLMAYIIAKVAAHARDNWLRDRDEFFDEQ